MKSSAILVGVAAAFTAAQQGFPDGFPQCGVTCVQNMLSQASELGCADITAACLCTKQNFIYGVRDCATESCPDQSAAQQVIQYGSQYCASAGVDISGAPTATGATPSATTTVVATASPTNSADGSASSSGSSADSSAGSSTGTGTGTGTGGATASGSDGSGPVAIATTTIQSTITNSDGSVITSDVGTSTVFSSGSALSTGSAASGSESVTGSLTTGVTESSFTSDGSTLVTSVTTTGTADANETSEGSNDSATETPSSTSNPAAQRTAAPVGLIAAAGLAALML
ncbi:hypothetical protein Hte_003727 [Hypoxylon texense]